ncbi:Rare lipoprotein B [Desulfovibrio sp. X2]|uniref:LPS assembly lipoprotein LptE n=1 Tax=Desulfovibrio sp. X2 TaxID=941449 RepID=UPI00035887FA|nr:LPS assembly lipoprotein LptE [Desulfovibrio sp. X2]EPR44769.1 Rare lipoprotein B [Desulfovibrio sp. X2]
MNVAPAPGAAPRGARMRRGGFPRVLAGVLLATALLVLPGCARYGFTPKTAKLALPPDVHTIAIRKVTNPTMYTWLPARAISNYRDEISQRDVLKWTDKEQADAVVDLTIKRFYIHTSLQNKQEETLEYSASVTLYATYYRRTDNSRLWEGQVSYSEAYTSSDVQSAQERALDEAVRRLVDQLYNAY